MIRLIQITTETFLFVKMNADFTNASNIYKDIRLKVNTSIPVDRHIPTNRYLVRTLSMLSCEVLQNDTITRRNKSELAKFELK
jgi:uncharacterized protein YpiB (UPF0302 family)